METFEPNQPKRPRLAPQRSSYAGALVETLSDDVETAMEWRGRDGMKKGELILYICWISQICQRGVFCIEGRCSIMIQ